MSNKKFNARHGVSVGTTPVDVIDDTGAVLTNAATATKLLNSRTISISGDVVATGSFDGSGNLDLAATIQANSVALGTDTTGNYMVDVSPGTGVSVSHTQGEGSTATVSIGQAVATTDNVTFNNLTLAGELRGPATFIIDPAAVGDNTGKVVIKGDLQIDGTTTTINSTTLTVDDLVLTLGGDTAPSSDDTFDKGIEYRWFDTQARVGFFGFDRSTGKLTFIPQSSLSSGVYSGTTGEIDAKLDWSNVLNKPTIDNTTYNQLAVTTTGGALLRLNSSGGANDDVKFASGTNVTVAYTNDDTITISSSYIDTNTTYSVKASAQTNGAGIDLDAGGSGSGTDTVKILGSGGTTVTQTDADTITLSSTSVGDGALTVSSSAGATNTGVALALSGSYSANTSTARSLNFAVGPAITALGTFMTTATAGFIRRTGQDTYGIDTNTYLTSYTESDTLATVTGRGASTSTNITLSGGTTSLGHATLNTLTASTGSLTIKTADSTTADSRTMFISTGNTSAAGFATGNLTIRTGSSTGLSGGYAGDILIWPGNSDSTPAQTAIRGGASVSGNTTSGQRGDVNITGGDNTSNVTSGTVAAGYVYILGGTVSNTSTNVTKYTGGIYISGGGSGAGGTISYGSVNIGSLGQGTTYGTSEINIGVSGIVTTINGTVKLPNVGTSGFVKLGAGGQLSADTNTYLTSYTESDTLATVTGRGNTTTTAATFGGLVTAGQAGFSSATYASGRNRIWSFANSDAYGISYFQGAGGYASSLDMFGLHFGTATVAASQFSFVSDGRLITTGNIGSTSTTVLNLATAGNTGTWIGAIQDGTTGWSLSGASIGLKSDNTTYAAIGIGAGNGILYFARTTASGVGTMSSWLEVDSGGVANFKRARPQHNGSNLALVSEIPTVSYPVTSVSGTAPITVSPTTGAVVVSHDASGVTAGTYNNVTVNATGHVTGGSNTSYLTAEADTLSTVATRGNSYINASLGGISIGEAFANYDGWSTQLNVHGVGGHSRVNVKTDTVRMGVYAHNSWNSVSGVAQGGFVGTYNNYPLSFLVNTTQVGVFNTSGNFGLGITSPTARIHAVGPLSGSGGYAGIFENTSNGVSGGGYLFQNNNSNHSWGAVAEFRTITGVAGADRPSVIFSSDKENMSWSVGFVSGTDSTFRITKNHGHRAQAGSWEDNASGWGTPYLTITTAGVVNATTTLQQGGNQVLHAGNYTSYAATSNHNHQYNVNNDWLRDNNDDANVKLYGNTRQMAFRTDGTTEYASGVGGYPFAWMYGADAAANRLMLLNTTGDMWTSTNGWLSAALAAKQNTGSYLTGESDTLATVTGRGATASVPISIDGGVNNATNDATLYVTATNNNDWGLIVNKYNSSATEYGVDIRVGSGAGYALRVQGNNSDVFRVTGAGNVIATGSLSAASKSFLIPHPTKEGWKLRYGSLEGPENGVYIRGRLKGKNKIELPEYWTKLVDPDSITVTLTPIGKHQKLYVEDIADNVVTVANDGFFAGEINCFFVVYGERVDIDKLVVEYE